MANSIVSIDSLVSIYCTKLDHSRKWWQFWKPKTYWTTHYTAKINRTGQVFNCPPEVVHQLTPLLEAMELEIRRELRGPLRTFEMHGQTVFR